MALVVLAVGVVSFPLLLNRDVSLPVALITSVLVSRRNPVEVGILRADCGGLVRGGATARATWLGFGPACFRACDLAFVAGCDYLKRLTLPGRAGLTPPYG